MNRIRKAAVAAAAGTVALIPALGRAQSDDPMQSVPGYPTPAACLPLAKGYMVNQYAQQQIQAACDQALAVQREAYREKQARIAEQARIAAERAQAAADAQAAQAAAQVAAEAAAERAQEIAAEADRKRKELAEAAAENSPDNVCKDQTTAGIVMSTVNKMIQPKFGGEDGNPTKIIDMTHIVTVKNAGGTLACHGVMLLSDGNTLEGTLTQRPNAAGDMIALWEAGHWEPPLPPSASPPVGAQAATPAPTAPAAAPGPGPAPAIVPASAVPAQAPALTDSFHRGLADRTAWEAWFGTLSGHAQAGAAYWAAERSKPHPGSCEALPDPASIEGCADAKMRLQDADLLRKADPDYRQGWNSYQAAR